MRKVDPIEQEEGKGAILFHIHRKYCSPESLASSATSCTNRFTSFISRRTSHAAIYTSTNAEKSLKRWWDVSAGTGTLYLLHNCTRVERRMAPSRCKCNSALGSLLKSRSCFAIFLIQTAIRGASKFFIALGLKIKDEGLVPWLVALFEETRIYFSRALLAPPLSGRSETLSGGRAKRLDTNLGHVKNFKLLPQCPLAPRCDIILLYEYFFGFSRKSNFFNCPPN